MAPDGPDPLSPARALDQRALTDIYTQFSPRLYRYACRLLGDPRDAEDVVAETFQRFLAALAHGGGPQTHLSAYLYRTAHNLITDRYRRSPPPPLPLADDLQAPADDDPARSGPDHLAQARAHALLRRLTPEQRLVLSLKYFEGLSNAEVALVLGKPIGAVKALQHRALEALRRMLGREGWLGEGVLT